MNFDPADLSMLFGAQPGPDDRALALQRQLGLLGQLSGDRVLAPVGQGLQQNTAAQIQQNQAMNGQRLRLALEQRQQQQAAQQAQAALQQRQAEQAASEQRQAQEAALRAQQEARRAAHEQAALAETGRHNRASERNAAERPSPFQIVVGEGGAQYYVDPRNPNTPAQPVVGPDGKPIAKPRTSRPLSTYDKNALDDLTAEINAVSDLSGRFKPDYAGGGPMGGMATRLYQTLGSAGTQGMQQDAAFWGDFNRLIDLPQRNKVFGASLSQGEKSSWEGAKNIKPSSSPQMVTQKLAEMQAIMQRKLTNVGASLAEEGYDPEAIQKRTGGLMDPKAPQAEASAPSAAPVRRFTRDASGKLVEVKP